MTASKSQKLPVPKARTESAVFLTYVDICELTRPKTGCVVICDMWWTTHPDRGALFFNKHPQYHIKRDIAEFLRERQYPWAEVHFIGLAYIPKGMEWS